MTTLKPHTRGARFRAVFTLGNGWVGASFDEIIFTLRRSVPDSSVLDDADADVVAQASLTEGGITVAGAEGTIVISAELAKLWPTGKLHWDLKGRAVGVTHVYSIDDGTLIVKGDITRSLP